MRALHIAGCYFELPSDFDGSIGDALMLMANRAKQSEVYKEAKEVTHYDLYTYFTQNRTGKCVMEYDFIEI